MTIRNTWCSDCQETCRDHPSICTVCGSELEAPPSPPERQNRRTEENEPRVRAVPENMLNEARTAGRDLRTMLFQLRNRISDTEQEANQLLEELQQYREEWERIPAEWMEPNPQQNSRPTSKEYLDSLPRINVTDKSAILRQGSLECKSLQRKFEVIPAEFGPNLFHLQDCRLIVPQENFTCASGVFDKRATRELDEVRTKRERSLVYLERGQGVTFCRKALLAQAAGAHAVVIGNNTAQPWPYVMKDSQDEATKEGLKIPVVMVNQADGKSLRQCPSGDGLWSLDLQSDSKDCVICTEEFKQGQELVRLPACGHHFHVDCALPWLTAHNTCPYCRRELPTDDPEYEAERRRTERTHAGGIERGSSQQQADEFYS